MLTCEQIMSMPAGRKLDDLVAEYVMGIPVTKKRDKFEYVHVPRYSDDISIAWVVATHFKSKSYLFSLKNLVGGKYEFTLNDWGGMCSIYTGQGDTPSRAICTAALLTTIQP